MHRRIEGLLTQPEPSPNPSGGRAQRLQPVTVVRIIKFLTVVRCFRWNRFAHATGCRDRLTLQEPVARGMNRASLFPLAWIVETLACCLTCSFEWSCTAGRCIGGAAGCGQAGPVGNLPPV